MHALQAFRSKAGSVPVGMAVLPEGSTAAKDSVTGPWLLLVTANVRHIGFRPTLQYFCSKTAPFRPTMRYACSRTASAPSSARGLTDGVSACRVLQKRVALSDMPLKNRGGQGLALLKTNEGDRLIALHVVGSGGGISAQPIALIIPLLMLARAVHEVAAALTDGEEGEEILLGSAGGHAVQDTTVQHQGVWAQREGRWRPAPAGTLSRRNSVVRCKILPVQQAPDCAAACRMVMSCRR